MPYARVVIGMFHVVRQANVGALQPRNTKSHNSKLVRRHESDKRFGYKIFICTMPMAGACIPHNYLYKSM
jgi:hypothetical protein